MANTNAFLKKERVEPFVRTWLASKFGKPFHSEFLPLAGTKCRAAKHEFDAVSEDRKIVCGNQPLPWTSNGVVSQPT